MAIFTPPRYTPVDGNSRVMPGAQLFFYITGSSTLQNTYTDSGLTTPNTNPVVADANGLFGPIYLGSAFDYKVILQTSANVTVWTVDPIATSGGASTTFVPQGRLTLASGTPVMAASQTAATIIYYTPYTGNQVPIYDGVSSFSAKTFTELSNVTTASSGGSAGPAAVANNKNYDLFVWSNAGVLTLTRGAAWNSDTARSAATENDLQRINGILVNKNAILNGPGVNLGTYMGTARSDGSAQLNWQPGGVAANGTAALLNVWNTYNRVSVSGFIGDSTDSWTYTTATYRPANNSATMRVSFVQGIQEDTFSAEYNAVATTNAASGVNMIVGIGYDSTSAKSGLSIWAQGGPNTIIFNPRAVYDVQALGFHFMQALEESTASGTTAWYGDNGAPNDLQSGLRYSGRF